MNKIEKEIIYTLDKSAHHNIPKILNGFKAINELNKKVASDYLLVGPGDDAAAYRVPGTNIILVEKMESHNSPAVVHLYDASATCPGGAARDVVAMGARPLVAMSAINVGALDKIDVVVGPCGFKGKCTCGRCKIISTEERIKIISKAIKDMCEALGIAIIGGGLSTSMDGNVPAIIGHITGILVCKKPLLKGARNVGDKIILIGETSNDGNDSLYRAGMVKEMKPAKALFRQERITMEASLAAIETNEIQSASDLGAAGIAAAVCDTARDGNLGAEVDLVAVPLKKEVKSQITTEEILICETQARMLLTVKTQDVNEILGIIRSKGARASVIGEITLGSEVKFFGFTGELVATIPNKTK